MASLAWTLKAWFALIVRSGARVTIIAADGRVMDDTAQDPQRMENHAGRPEVREAMATGEGRAVRFSRTLNRDLLYIAMRYKPGSEPAAAPTIIRLALPVAQIDEALKRIQKNEYGLCANCQEEMLPKRLDAVPWTKHCIACQEKKEQGLL